MIQENRKADLGKKISKFATIGSLEDFLSRRYSTIIVSMVRTQPFAEHGGALLNSQDLIDFLKSRVKTDGPSGPGEIVVISKSECLNDLWRNAFYSASNVNVIEQ